MISILFQVAGDVLRVYTYVVILAAIVSTLIAFDVLDTRNRGVWIISDFLYRITEPFLRRIRRVLPTFGGVDFSPWVLVILLMVTQEALVRLYAAIVFGNVQALIL